MTRHPWRVGKTFLYFRGMGRRRPPREIEPERLLPGLDRWAGLWVAIKEGEVIAVGGSSLELVAEVKKLGSAGEGAVAQYVPPYSEEIVIGVG